MRNGTMVLALVAAACLAAPAGADWNEGDSHKMHYPQLPDPSGWDVDITRTFVADDWQCSETGPVDDIHFWVSWQGDQQGDMKDNISQVWVRVWPDIPDPDGEGPAFSMPDKSGEPLFDRLFNPCDIVVRDPEYGQQGWYSPYAEPEEVIQNDHNYYYQVNISEIQDPMYQQEGTIYWLELHVVPVVANTYCGWKTSQDHWNDDSVWEDVQGNSNELFDPILDNPPVSLDQAFVITPEPATMSLLAVGAVALLRRRRG